MEENRSLGKMSWSSSVAGDSPRTAAFSRGIFRAADDSNAATSVKPPMDKFLSRRPSPSLPLILVSEEEKVERDEERKDPAKGGRRRQEEVVVEEEKEEEVELK